MDSWPPNIESCSYTQGRVDFHCAAMLGEDLPDHPEAHAVSMGAFSCDAKLEQSGQYLRRDTASFIVHDHLNCICVSF